MGNFEDYAAISSSASDTTSNFDEYAELNKSKYLQEYDSLGTSLNSGSEQQSISIGQNKKFNQDELIARKQARISDKLDTSSDDSNLTLKAKALYNRVNDLWDGNDLQAEYMGKKQTMSNKIFEDVNDTMAESEAKKQELISQYNNAVDDPNAKHKVYQLRIKDGYDSNGNPLYVYKTGIAETSAADRYKNQMIRGGYEILGEKGFANAEEWENKWHGLKANLQDRTFDEGTRKQSGFGAGNTELYNTQNFYNDVSNEDIAINKLNSEALANAARERRKEGYGLGSDSSLDAFQAGFVKVLADTGDMILDVATPGGDNTWLNEVKEQGNIDKYVGYNRKTADKAIGEATSRFHAGDYSGALWEVLKNPQITAESLPAMIEMALPLPTGKLTAAGKAYKLLNEAKAARNADDVAKYTNELANEITLAQKGIYTAAQNAGFLTQVASTTNNHIDERIKNNQEAGLEGGDSMLEVGGVFASNFLSLGLDRVAFNKITGIEGGSKALSDAFGFASTDGKRSIINGILDQGSRMVENGATEAAQEYIQTWSEIINQQLGTGKNGTLEKIFNDKMNQDEALGGSIAGAAGGIHMGAAADAVSGAGILVNDKLLGGEEKRNAEKLRREDGIELSNIASGSRTAEGLTGEDKIFASNSTVGAVARNGHNAVLKEVLNAKTGDDESAAVVADRLIKAVVNEYKDPEGAGSVAASKTMMNRNLTSFINSVFEDMESMQWKEDVAQEQFDMAKEAGLVDDTITPMDYMIDKINKQKQKVAEAIGKSMDDSGLDISGTIVDKFKKNYIDKVITDAAKRTRKDEININLNPRDNRNQELTVDDHTVELTEDEVTRVSNMANMLYAIGGNKDPELADMIDQLRAGKIDATTGVGSFKMDSGDVAREVLRDDSMQGKKPKKSILSHNKVITEAIYSSLDSLEAGKDADKDIKSVNKNVDELTDFADSRTNGLEHYEELISKIPDMPDRYNRIKENYDPNDSVKKTELGVLVRDMIANTEVGNLIDKKTGEEVLTKDGKNVLENPFIKFSQNERQRRKEAPIDDEYLNRFGRKNNTRKIYAGETYNGIMSSINFETKKISKEISNTLVGLNDLKNQMIKSGKDIADIDKRINELIVVKKEMDFANDMFGMIHEESQSRKSTYRKQLIVPGKIFYDEKTGVNRIAKLEDIAYELTRESVGKKSHIAKEQADKDLNEGKVSPEQYAEIIRKIDELKKSISGSADNLIELENIIDERETAVIFAGSLITDNHEANKASRIISRIYKKVFNNFDKFVFGKSETDVIKTTFNKTDKTVSFAFMQDNSLNRAHEIFHAMSFDKLSKSLTKGDMKFVEEMKNFLKTYKSTSKIDRVATDIEQLTKEANKTENSDFVFELAAILYSNGEVRRELVSAYEATIKKDDNYSSRRKAISNFIQSVFKAYRAIAHTLERVFSKDSDTIDTKSDTYRAMVKFVGNSMKTELLRSNTEEQFSDRYKEVFNKYEFDKDDFGNDRFLKEKGSNETVMGYLSNIDGYGKNKLNIDHNGKKINQRGIDTIMLRLKLGTLTKSEFDKLDSILKAYTDKTNPSDFNVSEFADKQQKEQQNKNEEKEKEIKKEEEEKKKAESEDSDKAKQEAIKIIESFDKNDKRKREIKSYFFKLRDSKEVLTEEVVKQLNDTMNIVKKIKENC